MRLPYLTMPLCLFLAWTSLSAQNLLITTQNPDALAVCGSDTLSVSLLNSQSATIANLTATVVLPSGISYISGSVQGALENNITVPNQPVFGLQDLPGGTTGTFTIQVRADCGLVEAINSGQLFVNQIVAQYAGGAEHQCTGADRCRPGGGGVDASDPVDEWVAVAGHGDGGESAGHDEQVDVVDLADPVVGVECDLAAVGDGAGLFGDEAELVPGERGERMVGADRVEGCEAGEEEHGAAAGHGAPATDRTKAGFYFTKLPPKQEMIYNGLQTDEIEIAPGEPEEVVQVEESFSPVFDLEMLVVGPHMHLVGKSIKVEKLAANSGAAETVIAIDNWDFDYQGLYTLKKKLPLEAGSGLRLTCSYDNSADNPRNPNSPPVKVVYGEASTDEMCLAFVGIVLPEGFNVGASQRQISQWLMRKTSGSKKGGSR